MLRRDDNRRPGRFNISGAKNRLAATESALVAAKSAREEAAKRLETAKAKHCDLLNSQVVYSRLAGTRSIETRSKPRLEIRRRIGRITLTLVSLNEKNRGTSIKILSSFANRADGAFHGWSMKKSGEIEEGQAKDVLYHAPLG
jgi:hypothetical protein